MKSKPLSVALTGWGGLDNPEPGLAVARALRDFWNGPLEILGLVYDTWTTGAWTPGIADSVHIISPIANGDFAALQRILAIHHEHPIDVLLPCLDLEVPLYARLAKRLLREGIRTLLPDPDDSFKITKPQLYWFGYTNQIITPKTTHVLDISSVALHADLFGYPLWVKGTVAGAKRVYNAHQAAYEASILAAKWGGGVLLQEAIEGSEHVVSMVAREDGSCLAMTMMRKIGLNARGKGMVGSVVEDPSLRKLALHILSKLNWRGPLELEFVRSQSNGQFYLLEVNCRFPSWIYLTALAGANQPMALVKEILEPGSRAPKQAKVGAMYARDVQEMVVPAASIVALARTGSAVVPAPAVIKSRRGDVSVAVTGISALELTQPGLGVGRSLRSAPEVGQVIGLGYASTDTGLFRKEIFDVNTPDQNREDCKSDLNGSKISDPHEDVDPGSHERVVCQPAHRHKGSCNCKYSYAIAQVDEYRKQEHQHPHCAGIKPVH
jgi:carbamoyl-phosphate synthase large subunit